MIKISLSLPHKRKQVVLWALAVLCVFVILASAVLSCIFYKKIKETGDYLKKTQGIEINTRFVFFNPFKGLSVYGLECKEGEEFFLKSGYLDVGFDLLSLAHRKVSVKNINLGQAHLYLNKMTELLARKNGLQGEAPAGILNFFETVHFKARDIWINDTVEIDLSGYLSFIKQKLFIARGKAMLKSIRIQGIPTVRLFENKNLADFFDYAVEIESKDGDLIISRCEFVNSSLRMAGKGSIKDYRNGAYVSLSLNLENAVLDNFAFLNSGRLRARGLFDAELTLTGPARALDVSLSGKMTNAQLAFFDSVSFDRINGSFVFFKNQLTSRNFCLSVNGIDLCSQMDLFFEDHPRVSFKLFTPDTAQVQNHFHLDFQGDWIDKSLKGGLDIAFQYEAEKTSNLLTLSMDDFYLGWHRKELFFSAGTAGAGLVIKPLDINAPAQPFSRDIVFKKLSSFIGAIDDGVVFDGIKAVCYGGQLSGILKLFSVGKALSVMGKARLSNVDIKEIFNLPDGKGPFLSGHLSGVFAFDSDQEQMLKGNFSILSGSIEKDPLLNSVADFLGVAALKKVVFDELVMSFSGGKGDYASQVRLFSDKVNAFLDAQVISYDKINGYLSVSLATGLLNESKQFSKILKYIKHSESDVVFPFQISSYVNSPRVLWLKNEFKEKLSNLLPESNKRYLQQQLNSMVEKMGESSSLKESEN